MKKILLVEDDPSLSEILAEKLKMSGYDVTCAENGEQGLAAAAKTNPQLILLDLVMPKMDGMTMLKKLRQEDNNNVDVIILTNIDPNKTILKDLENIKNVTYIVKSNVQLDSILTAVKKILKD